jgi:hypothetical protein
MAFGSVLNSALFLVLAVAVLAQIALAQDVEGLPSATPSQSPASAITVSALPSTAPTIERSAAPTSMPSSSPFGSPAVCSRAGETCSGAGALPCCFPALCDRASSVCVKTTAADSAAFKDGLRRDLLCGRSVSPSDCSPFDRVRGGIVTPSTLRGGRGDGRRVLLKGSSE